MNKPAQTGFKLKDDRRFLFIDDLRFVDEAFDYTHNTIYLHHKWVVVKNYNQFFKYILEIGVPDIVSFDHDLADQHYTPEEYWEPYEKSKAWQDAQVYTEKTGKDCALFLCEYCRENNVPLPVYYCHSQNPVGKDNILGVLDFYKKHETIKDDQV